MLLPVWLCSDPDDECWVFVAAPTRGKARSAGWWAFELDRWSDLRVRRVLRDGTIGGRNAQATVEATEPRELRREECAALGWRICQRCKERWTHEADGLCWDCEAECDAADYAIHGEGDRP